MGEPVGDVVGDDVVGESVGDGVGDDVVGESVGERVGDDVVGESVGDAVGDDIVGEPVGVKVGDVVGEVVGESVGLAVGSPLVLLTALAVKRAQNIPRAQRRRFVQSDAMFMPAKRDHRGTWRHFINQRRFHPKATTFFNSTRKLCLN